MHIDDKILDELMFSFYLWENRNSTLLVGELDHLSYLILLNTHEKNVSTDNSILERKPSSNNINNYYNNNRNNTNTEQK